MGVKTNDDHNDDQNNANDNDEQETEESVVRTVTLHSLRDMPLKWRIKKTAVCLA